MFTNYIHKIRLKEDVKKKINIFNNNKEIKYCNIKCEVCTAEDFEVLFNEDRYGIKQRTVFCKKCGFVYSNPRMEKNSLKIFVTGDTKTFQTKLNKLGIKNKVNLFPS